MGILRYLAVILGSTMFIGLSAQAATLSATPDRGYCGYYCYSWSGFTIEFDDDNGNGVLDISEIDSFSNVYNSGYRYSATGYSVAVLPYIEGFTAAGRLSGYDGYSDGSWAFPGTSWSTSCSRFRGCRTYTRSTVLTFGPTSWFYTLTGVEPKSGDPGYASSTDPTATVPVPPAALLFGTVLAGAGLWRRRRKGGAPA